MFLCLEITNPASYKYFISYNSLLALVRNSFLVYKCSSWPNAAKAVCVCGSRPYVASRPYLIQGPPYVAHGACGLKLYVALWTVYN